MMYKAKVSVYSDIRTKHSTQSERHVEFFNIKLWWYGKKPLDFKRLIKYKLVAQAYIMPSCRYLSAVQTRLLCLSTAVCHCN
jgi:hypothetical protein